VPSGSVSKTAAKKAKPLDLEGLLNYSARILAARPQTISELRRKLARRAAEPGDAEEAIRRLKESGYLDDQRFAESFAHWRRDNEGFGKTRVIRDLVARRVTPSVARQAVEKAYSAADETEMIRHFLERKFRGKDLHTLFREEKHLASAYRRLRTAGFSSANSVQALKRYASQAEELEDLENEQIE